MLNKNEIIILHSKNKFFGQTRKPWVSMDLEKINLALAEKGFKILNFDFHDLVNGQISINNSIVFYTFSQRQNVREYIKDVIFNLMERNFIIPSYDLLLCHENKGYQEILKSKLGVSALKSEYYYDSDQVNFTNINYPIDLKKVFGSNGNFVFLVKNEKELKSKLRKFEYTGIFNRIDLLRRKYFRKRKNFEHYPEYTNIGDYSQYKDYIAKRDNFILQEFVADLEYDYRILILYDKYFVTRRFNREKDFRASGSKKFDFSFELDEGMLNFAKNIYQKFKTPFLSLDICSSGNNYFILEYQAIHFGINVFVKSAGYFVEENGKWQYLESKNRIEQEIGYSLANFIRNEVN